MRRSHELVEDQRDLLRGMAVPERLRLRAGRIELLDRIEDVRGIGPHERVPSVLDGLDPLRLVAEGDARDPEEIRLLLDRKSTRLNSSHSQISYAVFCLKKKKMFAEHH